MEVWRNKKNMVYRKNRKMTDISFTFPLITLNVNVIRTQFKGNNWHYRFLKFQLCSVC